MDNSMGTGIVKWFNEAKGFGFIAMEDGREIFVHYSDLIMEGFKTLFEGDKVSFDIYEVNKNGTEKLTAKNVRKV